MVKKLFQLFLVILLAKVLISNQVSKSNHEIVCDNESVHTTITGTKEVDINYSKYETEVVAYFGKNAHTDHPRSV